MDRPIDLFVLDTGDIWVSINMNASVPEAQGTTLSPLCFSASFVPKSRRHRCKTDTHSLDLLILLKVTAVSVNKLTHSTSSKVKFIFVVELSVVMY